MKYICSLLIVPALLGCNSGKNQESVFVGPDPDLLADYYRYINDGSCPSEGQQERLIARALEMIELNGLLIRPDSEIELCSQGSVPTSVKFEGQEVPIDDLYTPAEQNMLSAAKSLAAMVAQS